MPMHVQHHLNLKNVIEIQVRNKQTLFLLTKILSHLASIRGDDASAATTANAVELAVPDVYAIDALLGENGAG
jgi:hypothetical protein